MTKNQNRYSFPMLLGKPSPSLAKINRMSRPELEAQIGSLITESDRIGQKMERLNGVSPDLSDRVRDLTVLSERLAALKKAAEDRIAQFEEEQSTMGGYRSKHYDLEGSG
jgi:hypothetical protein